MASMGSFDYLWGPMVLQVCTYMICLDLWDCSIASMGDYKSLTAVYGDIYVLLWGCGLRPMGNLWDHAAAVWHLWETISPGPIEMRTNRNEDL